MDHHEYTIFFLHSGIMATSGRGVPSFQSQTKGQRPPVCSDDLFICRIYATASHFIYYAARPLSWADAHHMHIMPFNVGYAALPTGIPSTSTTNDELKKCPAFMMLDMLILIALSAIGYNHSWQSTLITAAVCLRNEVHLLRTDTEIYYVRGGYS